jgi:MFS family permease
MALIGAAFGIGFTFGPLFGFFALGSETDGSVRYEYIGYAASALSLLALILGIALLPETRKFGDAPPLTRRWLDFSALRTALASAAIGPVILTFFLATLGFGAFEATLALLLKDALEFPARKTLLIFAYVGLVLVLTQGLFYRPLAKRWSEATFIAWGLILMAVGVGALGAMTYCAYLKDQSPLPLPPMLGIGITAAVIGFAFLTPSTNALISRRTDADRQGEILGVNQSASSMARILGPLLGVTMYKATVSHLLPYVFGAGILLLMLPMVPRIQRGE